MSENILELIFIFSAENWRPPYKSFEERICVSLLLTKTHSLVIIISGLKKLNFPLYQLYHVSIMQTFWNPLPVTLLSILQLLKNTIPNFQMKNQHEKQMTVYNLIKPLVIVWKYQATPRFSDFKNLLYRLASCEFTSFETLFHASLKSSRNIHDP